MEKKLIDLPFGENLKLIWDEYVDFVERNLIEEKDKPDLINQKNRSINYIKSRSNTEEEAIKLVKELLDIVKVIYNKGQPVN